MTEPNDAERPPIPGMDFVVSLNDLRREPVLAALSASTVVDSNDCDARIHAAATAAHDANDTPSRHALELLGQISRYHFKADDRGEPFGPMLVMGGRRSAIPADLQPEQVQILAQFVPEIGHPSFRARVADVCWLRNKRDADSGLRAVAAYEQCVRAVLRGEAEFDFDQRNPASNPAAEYLTRAMIIARAMGWRRAEFDSLRKLASDLSQYTLDNDDGWGFIHIGPVNLRNEIWELGRTAAGAESLAVSEKLRNDHPARRTLWELAANAHRRAKDIENGNRCLIEAAETFVGDADARPESASVQAHFLNDAIQALRPIPGTVERRRELQGRLNAIQPRIPEEMSSFSHETDIRDLVEDTEKAVADKPIASVIHALLMCERCPNPEALRVQVLKEARERIAPMFAVTVSDSQGRTRFIAPGLDPVGEPDEEQVRFLTNRHDSFRRSLVVSARINPIRRVLRDQHSVTVASLQSIMEASAFVPHDHAYTFALGAFRFIAGDDLEAAHLILPQLENSLRHILSVVGVETNRMNQDGTQEEAMLSRLLGDFREPLLKLMPAAILQEVDLLFNFRGGPSIRNELAHGKLADGDFWGPDVTYSIWLVLHMTILPTLSFWDNIAPEISRRCL